MSLRGGAIIVGSLLWDTKIRRKKWRENDLCCEKKFQVYLPIRYGRRSTTRENTYTMIFSNKCYLKGYKLGTGWIFPIRAEINSFKDLKVEAKKMGKAECISDRLSNKWGSVALLLNPNKKIDTVIKEKWKMLMTNRMKNHPLLTKKLKSEKSSIDCNGFLTIRWPEEVRPENRIEKLDFLIATVTKPKLINKRYPTAYKIADAMRKANYDEYFKENRKHKITTFQDERISEIIKRIRLIK